VIRDLLASSPEAIHPVTREITIAGARLSAADTFGALYGCSAAQGQRACVRRHRRAGAADGADGVQHSPGAGQSSRSSTAGSGPIPISSTCSISAASPCRRRYGPTISRSASRCWRPPGQDAHLASIGRVFHADTKLNMAAEVCRSRLSRPCRRTWAETKSPSRWSARISPAWRSIAN